MLQALDGVHSDALPADDIVLSFIKWKYPQYVRTESVVISTVIASEAERLAWVASESTVTDVTCHECGSDSFPKYLACVGV